MDKITRICLWSGPRNISTTLMYSFAQRNDTQVFDEPLYAHYLSKTDAKEYHPGAEKILAEMENDGEKVIDMMMSVNEYPVYFFKNMTHHFVGLDKSFFPKAKHILLTRDPREMLPSFDKVIRNPSMNDVGYLNHVDLMNYFEKHGVAYLVLDAKRLLLNPEQQLKLICNTLEIPFQAKMLTWKKGARPEDGSWAKYWYHSIHNSTGYKEYSPKSEPFPVHLELLYKQAKPLYDCLLKRAI